MTATKANLVTMAVICGMLCFALDAWAAPPPSAASPSADAGEAAFVEGRAYYRGDGVGRDLAKALELYKKSTAEGNPKAMTNLAQMYLTGEGVAKDEQEAAHLLLKASDSGAALAQYNLADLYVRGVGVEKSASKALTLLLKSAEGGYAGATKPIATLYYFGGEDLPPDYEKAIPWLEKLATEGDAWAENNLGVVYWCSLGGVPEDDQKAFSLFRRAAGKGNVKAQSSLGQMYMTGSGVAVDNLFAYFWLQLAIEKHEVTAQNAYGELKQYITPELAARGDELIAAYHKSGSIPESEISQSEQPSNFDLKRPPQQR